MDNESMEFNGYFSSFLNKIIYLAGKLEQR